MVTWIWFNICSGNGLLLDGTKPLPEPVLTYYQSGSVAFNWGKILLAVFKIWLHKRVQISLFWNHCHVFHGNNQFIPAQWILSWPLEVKMIIATVWDLVSARLNTIRNIVKMSWKWCRPLYDTANTHIYICIYIYIYIYIYAAWQPSQAARSTH